MSSKHLPLTLSGLLGLASLITAADAAGPQLMVQTQTIALDPLTHQTRGGMRWSHGAFLFQTGGAGLPPTFYTLDRRVAWFPR